VRGLPDGVWSETRRFQIAAQSQWQFTRTLGDLANRLQIGSDPIGDTDLDYDVSNLHVAQASDYWYFGFATPASPVTNVTYALYLDLDHKEGSGGTSDPKDTRSAPFQVINPNTLFMCFRMPALFLLTRFTFIAGQAPRWTGTP